MHIKRPTFLTIWLVLMALAGVYSLYSYTLGAQAIKAALPSMPSWVFVPFTSLGLLSLVSVFLLWTWKKLGFYLVIASSIISVLLNGAISGLVGIVAIIFALAGVGILYLAMKPVWQNFK